MSKIFPILLAALAGVTMAVQGTLNSFLGKFIGLWESTFVVHLLGTVVTALLLLFLHGGKLLAFTKAPWYAFLGGFLGVFIIFGVVSSISKIGATIATTAIIVGQVTTACLLDHFGLFGLDHHPFTWWKGAGIVLLAVGARLLLN